MQQTSKPCHTIHNGEYHVHNTERIFALKRPTLLFKAASIALASYDRSKRLQGLLGSRSVQSKPAESLRQLMDEEYDCNDKRLKRDADYVIATHINLLTASLAEALVIRSQAIPERQAPPLFCVQHIQPMPHLSPDQALVFDNLKSDNPRELTPGS